MPPVDIDFDGPRAATSLLARRLPLASAAEQLKLLDSVPLEDDAEFERTLHEAGIGGVRPSLIEIFQINLGKLCNMTCRHCHVDAGPDRTDAMMSRETAEACLRALDRTDAHTVDLTGGAPELHPQFRFLVEECARRGKHVIDRCNLTVLLLKRNEHLPLWMGERGVEIVASLPHYRRRNTNAQRGDGAFEKSIEALHILNDAGYGHGDPTRTLTLMSNPAGAFLSADQNAMERDWKRALLEEHGIRFDRLIALNNMPISRFLEWLVDSGNLEPYMRRLVGAFNPEAVDGLMCRNTLSVSWDGRLFDCDFNQMLDLESEPGEPMRIENFDPVRFSRRRIITARHCYGCTAGCGSSCGGATVTVPAS